MSIYIPGMEMPKDEPLLVKINPDGTVSTTARNNYKKYEAVELLQHGRMIDVDLICAECKRVAEEYDGIYPDCTYCPVNLAPAVIEADPPKEET